MNIQKAWYGSSSVAGVIPLVPVGTPAHQLPTADRLDAGSASQGEQRVTARDYVFVEDATSKTVQVTHTGSGHTTVVEGCILNPDDDDEWFTISTITGDGEVLDIETVCRWLRVRMSVLGIGGGTSAARVNTSN